MRTLCLNLPKTERPSIAETFLAFSPRVHYRAPGLVFVDVAATAGRFGGEAGLLSEVQRLTGDFFPGATAALADTPAAAQLLSRLKPFSIVAPQTEPQELKDMPLSALVHLEGLVAWRTLREIENVIDFFYGLGIKRIGDLSRFSSATLSERFGVTGTVLWRRLHGQEKQIISPLIPVDPLSETIHFDFGVSLLPLLLHSIEKSLQSLLARLHGRREVANKVLLHLHCEHGQRYHLLEIKPASPHRELNHFMNLIEDQLANVDLENPVKELSLELLTSRDHQDRLPRALSLVKASMPFFNHAADATIPTHGEARLTSGFLRPQTGLIPEAAWESADDFADHDLLSDGVVTADLQDDRVLLDGRLLQLQNSSHFGGGDVPKPTTLLPEPVRLAPARLARYQFLSTLPIEKIEDGGWDTSRGRDYYVALSPEGEACWLYHDRIEDEHYLQGYW
ncbi:MAG: hypothetical protein AB7N80_16005 [Bdellovibrionales bacterium]